MGVGGCLCGCVWVCVGVGVCVSRLQFMPYFSRSVHRSTSCPLLCSTALQETGDTG